MSVLLAIQVKDCSMCPYVNESRHYTPDSFEMVFDWSCKKKRDAHIATVEWNDPKPPIPAWCPLRVAEK